MARLSIRPSEMANSGKGVEQFRYTVTVDSTEEDTEELNNNHAAHMQGVV